LYSFSLLYYRDFLYFLPASGNIYSHWLFLWSVVVMFIAIKSLIIIILGGIFMMRPEAYKYILIDLKGWALFSIFIFPLVALQLNESMRIPVYVEGILISLPMLVILGKKLLFLFSIKEYSWLIKMLYLCSLEILLLFAYIVLIYSFI
jgi:hypothetical protein